MLKTLRQRMSFIHLVLVLMMALIGLISGVSLYRLMTAVDGLMTDNYKSIEAVSRMRTALEKQTQALLLLENGQREKAAAAFQDQGRLFEQNYATEAGNITEDGERALVADLNASYSRFLPVFSQMQSLLDTQGQASAAAYYESGALPSAGEVGKNLDALETMNRAAMFHSKDNTTRGARQSMVVILGVSVIAILGGLWISGSLVRRFLLPLSRLSVGIRQVRAGELDQHVDPETDDETGELAREFNNMTQRLKAFEQSAVGTLTAERNQTLAIVRSIGDPMLVLDFQFRIVQINQATETMFRLNQSQAQGRHLLEVIHHGPLFEWISAPSQDSRREKMMQLLPESNQYHNVVVTPVHDGEAKLNGLIVLMQDVTGLKSLEQAKTDFLATISHEFKTPLTSIMMGTSMLTDGSAGALTPEQSEIMDTIQEDSQRLADLVTQLLELARLESGSEVYHFAPCALPDIVANSLKQFTEPAYRKGIELSNLVPQDLPPLTADAEKLGWVLNNLVSNALKYCNAGDAITVSAFARAHVLTLRVQDTGAGIPEALLDKIFDRFVQGPAAMTESRGTGIGLAVCREIIHAHGGDISVNSRLDDGSTFTARLPLRRTGEQE